VDKRYFFERNLLALSVQNPELCSRLSVAETTLGHYRFLETYSGELIPALVDRTGNAHALHSTIDPAKEADRLLAVLKDKNGISAGVFVIFFGLGAGFAPLSALNSGNVSHVLVIDYDINGIAELFCSREYISLLGDPRCTLLVDPHPDLVVNMILELYRPALCGGIRVLPLRPRVEPDKRNFSAAMDAVQRTIEKLSQDYSVQAYFGMRWFGNIIRNLGAAQHQNRCAVPIREAAICAAGPSLDGQIPLLLEQKSLPEQKLFVIAADTALPALLHRGLRPDAVVSIDCQHISYYHFIGTGCSDIPLFLDIASPPMLSQFSVFPFFFSGGHPLAVYVSQQWRPLPLLDTSGGNVGYACLSLAESLGARRITVYGADFSYPFGRVYAKGTYIYPFFEQRQNRLFPLESHLSSFLYRSPFLQPETESGNCMYETAAMRFYRKSFEEKASVIKAQVSAVKGSGIPLVIRGNSFSVPFKEIAAHGTRNLFAPGKAVMNADTFLEQYRDNLAALPVFGNRGGAADVTATGTTYLRNLGIEQSCVFITLLPQMAAIRYRHPELSIPELTEEVKRYCILEIEKVLNSGLL
jgi:uncharacterized Rossmann fold enzyme